MTHSTLDIHSLAWPISRLGEALEILAQKTGFSSNPPELPLPPKHFEQADNQAIGQWLERASSRLGLEIEAVESSYTEVEKMVQRAGPAFLRLPGEGLPHFLVLLKGGWSKIALIAPDLSLCRIPAKPIRDALTYEVEAPLATPINQLLNQAGVPEQRRARAKTAILREQLSSVQIKGCWLLRLSPAISFWQQIRQARLPRYTLSIIIVHLILSGFNGISSWVMLQASLQGEFDRVWLLAWALILFTTIPFQISMVWNQSLLTIGMGSLFKQRLLYGTLQLKPEEISHQGIGQFLGRVMESEAVESLFLSGGFAAFIAVIELVMALVVLTVGTGGWLHAILLFLWIILALLMIWRYFKLSRSWLIHYRGMTNDLVERMVGHRTRLAQEDQAHWHDEEDQMIARYLVLSEKQDKLGMQIQALINRGWLLVGLSGLSYSFIINPSSPEQLAVSLAGIMLASKALSSIVGGLQSVINLMNAWGEVSPLFHAASRGKENSTSVILPETHPGNETPSNVSSKDVYQQPILSARDLYFRYRDYGQPILQGCSLQINKGDRILLEGPSGGGKSTLAAILVGLRSPESGLLLLQGLDQHTLGQEEWRRRVVSAPQFHQNHVLTETFSFNLLMGRQWPPTPEDMEEAEKICRELGLGELLERMPAGFQQMVGESGWQLSHGERSRLFMARALLQKADMIVLDESFAALDPENLQKALQCVLNRAPTLLVIAHP
jgi:ATP-binding cassette, subfamily B, bacterial